MRHGLRRWAGRGGLAVGAPLFDYAMRFLRTIVLAKLLAPAEFGLAMALATVVFMSESATDLGADRYVVLHRGEPGRRALAAAHTLQLCRGLLIAAGLLLLAQPIAALFQVPQSASSFALVALLPLLRGVAHLGVSQAQQDYRFGPYAAVSATAQVVGFAGGVAAAVWLGDHRAILVAFLAEAAAFTAASWRVAGTRFQLSSHAADLGPALRFGLPLMLNGVGLALIGQADRVVVGWAFGPETLAVYGLALTLAVVPISPVFKGLGALSMPLMANAAPRGAAAWASAARVTYRVFAVAGLAYALGIALALDVALPALFGPAYGISDLFHVLLAAVVLLRVLRGAPTVALMAAGRTVLLSVANLSAALGVAAAIGFVLLWPGPEAVTAGILLGDALSLSLAWLFAGRRMALHGRGLGIGVTVASGAALVAALALWPEANAWQRPLVALVGVLVLIPACLAARQAWIRRRAEGAAAAS
ncbi:MAG: oligosaccharide flippase family protein [Acetobacteraceae bacterium]|nr:oligosaccharide flippase family protein [Acetobacteraceae bacterium]